MKEIESVVTVGDVNFRVLYEVDKGDFEVGIYPEVYICAVFDADGGSRAQDLIDVIADDVDSEIRSELYMINFYGDQDAYDE